MRTVQAAAIAFLLAFFAAPASADEDRAKDQLAEYLDTAALGWLALPPVGDEMFVAQEGEPVAAVRARVAETAKQVAAEALRAPIWKDEQGEKTGLLLMSLALHESRFRGYVDDGRCGDKEWRASEEGKRILRLGTCDSGKDGVAKARSMWQLHNFRSDMRADAIAEALRRARWSLRRYGDLRGYTGETDAPYAKAKARLETAAGYAHANPIHWR